MKKMYSLLAVSSIVLSYAQVGINTTDPQATLDVNGNVIIRTIDPAPANSTYDFLVRNPTTNVIATVNGNLAGSSSVNMSIAKAETKTNEGVNLLELMVFNGFRYIDFKEANISIDSGSNFSASTSTSPSIYTIPSTGIYEINYVFRYGTGAQLALSLFGNPPRVGIIKRTDGTTPTVLDERAFSGANVELSIPIIILSPLKIGIYLTISNTSINSIYNLVEGDQLSFGMNPGGLAALDLLGDSFASVHIKKISD